MSILDGMYNCWAMYWAPSGSGPGDVDEFGIAKRSDPVVMKANWRSGVNRQIQIDGAVHVINDVVVTAEETEANGILLRLSDSLNASAANVLANNIAATPPADKTIQSVSYQSDLDDVTDTVYTASI